MRAKDNQIDPENQKVTGSHLQHLREEKGLSLKDVSEETKISVATLKALEEHDYDKLPADTFTRGFLTLYGKLLGIDGAQIAARYIEERNLKIKQEKTQYKNLAGTSLSTKKLAEPSHIPSATVAALLFSFIVVSFTAFCIYNSWNPFAYFTNKTKDISMSVLGSFQENTSPEMVLVPGEKLSLDVSFIKDTTVEVSMDGAPVLDEKFSAGQSQTWSADKELTIRLIEPASATLKINNEPIPYPDDHSGFFLFQLESDG